MARRRVLVILGMMGRCPFGGQTWLYLNWLRGFQRLGHEVWYVEDDATWPYDPVADTISRGPALRRPATCTARCPPSGWATDGPTGRSTGAGRSATACRSAACAISTGGATR